MLEHTTVLLTEALQALDIKADGIYVDCTFGRGGHSSGILQQLGESGRLLAFDRDPAAIASAQAQELLQDQRFALHYGGFAELLVTTARYGYQGKVDGILLDLGVSSPQLDEDARGFSFMRNGPLDMRMDFQQGLSAADYLQQVDETELTRVLFEYGEERFAKRIAKAIVSQRETSPLTTTAELAKLIEGAMPFRDKHKHPATRSFQAIRIAVNQELEQLREGLDQALQVLASGGRLVVISFHSLEDRIVKRFIRDECGRKHNPGRLPVKEQDIEQGLLRKIGGSVRAGQQEIKNNPRARSAIMRIAERI